ncbi:MAG: PAS domain-containing protein, partial [Chlorobiales bacterium]|nr:PAS domain-containing protein [Chlorobiales bacterium]
ATHRIIEINQSAADLFGLPIEAIIGSRREMFLELSQADLNRIREGQTLHKREAGLTRSDGCLITVTMSVIPIHEQGHNYLAVNFFDISDISTGAPKSVVSVGEIQD